MLGCHVPGLGQEDNFYPYDEIPVKYLFVNEK